MSLASLQQLQLPGVTWLPPHLACSGAGNFLSWGLGCFPAPEYTTLPYPNKRYTFCRQILLKMQWANCFQIVSILQNSSTFLPESYIPKTSKTTWQLVPTIKCIVDIVLHVRPINTSSYHVTNIRNWLLIPSFSVVLLSSSICKSNYGVTWLFYIIYTQVAWEATQESQLVRLPTSHVSKRGIGNARSTYQENDSRVPTSASFGSNVSQTFGWLSISPPARAGELASSFGVVILVTPTHATSSQPSTNIFQVTS